MKRTTEQEIAACIARILKRKASRRATIAELIECIPNHVRLTRADLAPSPTRRNEAVWEQRVRNVVSHQSYARHGLKWIDGGFTLPGVRARKAVHTERQEARA